MPEVVEPEEQVVKLEGERLTIGSSNANDVVLDDPSVSRYHVEIVVRGDELELRDLDSASGTRLNGRPVKHTLISTGAEIGVGPFRLRFDGSSFVRRNERGALRLDAVGLSKRVEGEQILDRASLSVEPGELVGLIGESGSGKTTLLKALAGVVTPSAGTVTLNGEPVTARLTDIGYVPQEEIVHPLLSVREALTYAARLRLPDDPSKADVKATIARVLAEVSLEQSADTRIGRLSGGERKRAGVASELLNRPSMLFLDEPTTGLDPSLESQLMQLFRDLAQPGSRAVVVVTHATKNLALCDRLAVIGRGGKLTFVGSPDAAVEFFGVESYDDIYAALSERPAEQWRTRFERRAAGTDAAGAGAGAGGSRGVGASAGSQGVRSAGGSETAAQEPPEPKPAGASRPRQPAWRQVRVLVARYARLLVRDWRNLAILLGQVPILALASAYLFQPGLFDRLDEGLVPQPGRPGEAVQLLFIVATTAIWLGAIDAAREIVKERSISPREAAIGVRWGAYLASKAIVLFGLATLQAGALAFIVFTIHPLEAAPEAYGAVVVLLILSSLAAVAMGLAISAASRTEAQATSFIPLALIPQLLFAGAIVPVERMSEPMAALATVVFGRWSLAGIGSAIDMNARIAADPRFARVSGYGEAFFDIWSRQVLLILLGFLAFFLLAAFVLVRRER